MFAWSFSASLLLLTPNSGSSFSVASAKNETGFLAIDRKAKNWKKKNTSRDPIPGNWRNLKCWVKSHHAARFFQVVLVFPCFVEVVVPDEGFVSVIRSASCLQTSEAAEHHAVDEGTWIGHLSKEYLLLLLSILSRDFIFSLKNNYFICLMREPCQKFRDDFTGDG